MGKIGVPYLVIYENKDGSKRFYFAPRQDDRQKGWATVRLHDKQERPIRDPLKAAEACEAVAEICVRWRAGELGYGPWRIDKLGRVVGQPTRKDRKPKKQFRAGQIGAMVADYMDHDVYMSNTEKTKAEYKIYLDIFVEKFGESYWRKLAPGVVREWLLERAASGGPAGAHALYRTARAFFGRVRLCYDTVDHPGFVPKHENPLLSLDLELPKSTVLVWPRAAVEAFVELADETGEPSIGDAIVMMSWLGVRRQDWLEWSADAFDRELIAFNQEKTDVPNVLPWSLVPDLVRRVAAAKERRKASAVSARTFFHDRDGRPWASARAFRHAFNKLRDKLEQEYGSFVTRYYVGLIAGEPLAVPTSKLTMRTMRHTCVTLNFDAGVPPNLIAGITGHRQDEIDEILAHYRARTADQAAAALELRLAHEAKKGGAA
jgi:integrase